jgi:hypothetical protein
MPFKTGQEPNSSGFTSQLYARYPEADTQRYANVWSKHVPPFRHGADEHSSSSDMHVPTGTSLKPAAHVHVYENTPCAHVAPFRHGVDAHSLMSVSQIAPLYPATHVHV